MAINGNSNGNIMYDNTDDNNINDNNDNRGGKSKVSSGPSKKASRNARRKLTVMKKAEQPGAVIHAHASQHIPGLVPAEFQVARAKGAAQPKAEVNQSVVAVASVSAAAAASGVKEPAKAKALPSAQEVAAAPKAKAASKAEPKQEGPPGKTNLALPIWESAGKFYALLADMKQMKLDIKDIRKRKGPAMETEGIRLKTATLLCPDQERAGDETPTLRVAGEKPEIKYASQSAVLMGVMPLPHGYMMGGPRMGQMGDTGPMLPMQSGVICVMLPMQSGMMPQGARPLELQSSGNSKFLSKSLPNRSDTERLATASTTNGKEKPQQPGCRSSYTPPGIRVDDDRAAAATATQPQPQPQPQPRSRSHAAAAAATEHPEPQPQPQPRHRAHSIDDEPDVPTTNPEAVQPHILDGLNIMRHRNVTDAYVDENIIDDNSLKWQQLNAAGLYYKTKGRQVLIFLPRLAGDHKAEFEELIRNFGKDCVVTTPYDKLCAGYDDKFMISYAQDNANSCIVTNDMFRDHGLPQSWVKDHTIKFAFAAGRFVPESVHK